MIVKTKFVLRFNAAAITVFPFIFVDPDYLNEPGILKHEETHLAQQKLWAIYGLGVGLLAWFFVYLLCLPVWYNYFRRKWETEAYQAGQGYTVEQINEILRQPPYYLK